MRVNSAEDLHQSRLARAVLTDQRMNLTLVQIKGDTIKRPNTRERIFVMFSISRKAGAWSWVFGLCLSLCVFVLLVFGASCTLVLWSFVL